MSNQDKTWVPYLVHTSFNSTLSSRSKNGESMPFSTPTTCRKPQSHDDCYFCLFKVGEFSVKNDLIKYPGVSSVTKPLSYAPCNVITSPPQSADGNNDHHDLHNDHKTNNDDDKYDLPFMETKSEHRLRT